MSKKTELLTNMASKTTVQPSINPLRDSALRTAANWFSQIVISGVLILSARNYSFEDFSFLSTSLAIATGLVSLVDLGTTAQWTVMLSKKTLSLSRWRRLLEYKINLAILLVLLSSFTWVLLGPIVFASCLLFLLILSQQSFNVLFITTSKNQIAAFSTILDRAVALSMCLTFIFVPLRWNHTLSIFLPFLLGPLSSVIFLFLNAQRNVRPRIFRNTKLGIYAKESQWFAINSISSSLRGLDIVLLGTLSNSIQTALYSSVSKMIVPLNTAATALSSVTTPHFSNSGLNRKTLRAVRSPVFLLLLICALALTPVLFAKELVVFLLGARYADAGQVLSILLFAGVASAAGIVFTSTLEAVGRARSVSIVSIITLTLQVSLCLVLLPMFGAIGAAYALATSTVLAVFILIALAWKAMREDKLVS